ncbi:hypothetical protein MKW94_008477 [Papaver nudicaule]|uniref:glycine--tRNA ligase n=1 Tax=Papaver nudicaule TaxID=74823 RepID=A0AA41UWC3_PAPNU|nr:hypothetical protein [Papaver nudicaule]
MESSSSSSSTSDLTKEEFRKRLLNTLDARYFIKPSFKIYGAVAGLNDYGPPGCAVKQNVLAFWRKHFVLEENMLEVDCPCITPAVVFKASGHVDKFTDFMVKDEITGECHRADHLLKDFCTTKLEKDIATLSEEKVQEYKDVLATLDGISLEELGLKIKEYGILAQTTNNPLSAPYPFNLMFQTSIGPSSMTPGYMRPETAQGIFVNFKDLYYYNGNKLPFAAAQVGQAFRNEISPRQGLLRVREFTLAEIEHFVDPEDKSHPKFSEVADLEFWMFPRNEQLTRMDAVKVRLGDAVTNGAVNNETLGYFIGRVYLFLTRLGINKERLRFRQHLADEMAHYAVDCWDAEIECSYGWIECVGIADRSAYDLRAHSEKSGIPLVAHEKSSATTEVEKLVISPVKKELGREFKGDQKKIVEALEAMDEKEAMEMKAALELNGEVKFHVCTLEKAFTIKSNMVSISKEIQKEPQRVFTPSVIEPSFGIGRIIYCLFEHSFYTRQNKAGDEHQAVAKRISKSLTSSGICNETDATSKSIGKRYAIADELGVPFAITVDNTATVTIRERDSRDQIRVEIGKVACVMQDLIAGVRTLADTPGITVLSRFRMRFSDLYRLCLKILIPQ